MRIHTVGAERIRLMMRGVVLSTIIVSSSCLGRTSPDKLMLPPANDRWTKELRVYDALDVNLEGYITYHSLDLRERTIARKKLDFHLGAQEVDSLRGEARQRRDFSEADRLRGELHRMGVTIEDTPQGTQWKLSP